MKKLFFSLVFSVFAWIWFSFASISHIELELLSPDVDMYLSNFYPDILWEVEKSCSVLDIDLAKEWYNIVLPKVKMKYANQPDFRILQMTKEIHDLYLSKASSISSVDQSSYCVLKYLLYRVIDDLRDEHLALMEKHDLIKDFEWFTQVWPIAWFELKKKQLQTEVDEMSKYKDLLWTELLFEDLNKESIATSGQYLDIKNLSAELLQLTVYKVLYNLKKREIIQQSDVDELKNKVKLEYHLSCANFHGNYRIKETLDHMWEHISYSTIELPLQINVCGNYFLLWTLADHYEKIVTHELWHHVFYYNDSNPDEFFEICRNDTNSTCVASDFITLYASTHPYEDYAESFMYRFLDLPRVSKSKLESKFSHFDNVFVK